MARISQNQIIATLTSNPVATGICATAVLGIVWTIHDFREWIAFGTGGSSPTCRGYLRMTKLRIKQALSNNNLLDASVLKQTGPSYLPSAPLPPRRSPRPHIIPRILPQRQRPEPIPPAMLSRLHSIVPDLASAHPDLFELSPSKTEGKTTDGLYARADVDTLNPVTREVAILDREIAHVHPTEYSLHVWLSERDARAVIERGWGARFPPLEGVPPGWVFVYAPRDEAEMDVVEGIVRAAVG
ncbi:hypothetical protein BO94DRAFT_212371 [Aspergillus sclerotioniger CBS 115572]|uniref:Luciferase domain-containing protein n=1 Tax=Aspergillus sclerotioniger CBS 115572 TaxID=1450535 RepID=A0A317VR00_9EURO|nr:hypothetical protein BO94DRAFT_212371 [Aspergillus sclerotioniger CBS 115572]PWY75322.1 hypothetical protein BO94DRAFT_212371 [Aspergillus sclerotioniger CBS 115572]